MASLSPSTVQKHTADFLDTLHLAGKRVLLVVPDSTRTAPVGLIFKSISAHIGHEVQQLDVMVALGTHPAMSEEQINQRLEISAEERASTYAAVGYYNHEWDNPEALELLGTIPAAEIRELSGGLFEMDVPVTFNKRALGYDQIIIIGPVFPHEVVGFSGGNKYLFPGIGGPEILNFFHWLGAVISNPKIIGHKWTPVRKVVDRAGAFVPVNKAAFCMVVQPGTGELAGLFTGTPEEAWSAAADLSDQVHIIYKPRAYHTVLSCAPPMYDDLWVGGKCMYKLEPVVEDGGELIIYAPHIHEISTTHGELIERIGYHIRDYFLADWDKWQHEPWGIIAHSTHVRGVGHMEDGVEKPRVRVTLATGIPPEVCARICMGYLDPATIDPGQYENREDEGILYVKKAGEMLYRLTNAPEWAQGG